MANNGPKGLARLLPASIADDPRLAQRGRLLLGFSIVLAVAALFSSVQVMFGGVMLLRWHGHLVVASAILCVVHLVVVLWLAAIGAGSDDSA
jgi:hypothetical protein